MADHEAIRAAFDAKLATVEVRSEARFNELSSKIDRVVDEMREFLSAVRGELLYTRIIIIVTVIAAVLSGLGALYVTQANLLAAFQTGLTAQQMHGEGKK